MNFKTLLFALIISLFAVSAKAQMINGVVYVAPSKKSGPDGVVAIKRTAANYIALNPYAYSGNNEAGVSWNTDWQWWGEKQEGVEQCILYARQSGFKIMMKPHVWVKGQGWAADYNLSSEEDWLRWEREYRTYILALARMSEKYKVEMFCVGTEYKTAVQKRPDFWRQLIVEVRMVYNGSLTYAANWDNYENIPFWNQLDYIGVDAYFPLVQKATPDPSELQKAWQPIRSNLKAYSVKKNKKVLFTEYGYRSVDFCAWKQWEIAEHWHERGECNSVAQCNAYDALYDIFWDESWIAGGFIWKWYSNEVRLDKGDNTNYSPQSKAVESIIRENYSKMQN